MARSETVPGAGSCCRLLILVLAVAVTCEAQTRCGSSFNQASGMFSSPGYPENRVVEDNCRNGPNSGGRCWDCFTECEWTITVPENMAVMLQIVDIYFKDRASCCRNYIDVRNGRTNDSDPLASLCGSEVPPPVFSTGRSMFIRLLSSQSHYFKTEHRFNATWSSVCRQHLTNQTGTLQSPGYPTTYPANLNCTFLIEQPRGYMISLQFDDFSLDTSQNGNCFDFVEVFDGGSDLFPLLGERYCGRTSPGQIKSTGNTMFLKFHSDAGTGAGSTGFRATYTRMTPDCPSGMAIGGPPATLTSPGFPEPFPEEATCSWTIDSGDDCMGIDITLDTIELGPNTDQWLDCDNGAVKTEVSLYDGGSSSSPLLDRFCKRNAFSQLITTTSRSLTIVYQSKNLAAPANWDSYPVHGFNASFNFTQLDICKFGGALDSSSATLLPYGAYSDDSRMPKNESIQDRTRYVKVESGIPVGNNRFTYVYIRQDGKVGFSNKQDDPIIKGDNRQQGQCRQRRFESVCAYCTAVDCTLDESVVYYNIHKRGNATLETGVFSPIKASVARLKGSNDFDPSVVVVATWESVRQENIRTRQSYIGFATFQVAVAVSDTEAYAIVSYKKDRMKWKFQPTQDPIIDAGLTTIQDTLQNCRDLVLSRTRTMLVIDMVKGNIGAEGAWVYKLGEVPARASQACIDWYFRNDGNLAQLRKPRFEQLPKCPCRIDWFARGITTYGIWVFHSSKTSNSGESVVCNRLTRAASRKFFPHGKECCYKRNDLIKTAPDAGSATAFNPSFSGLYEGYLREDRLAHEACCINSNSSLRCDNYYSLRPIGQCEVEPTFRFAWMCCDPHITTLDEEEYTFNGWGEYTMITLATSAVKFTMQARTDLAETETGKLSNATVFSAFGIEENGVKIFVGLDAENKTTLEIFGNNEDFSRRFNENPDFRHDAEDFLIQRNNDTFDVAYSSGISLSVAIREKSLAVSISIPKTFRNQTRGLLGNFNGAKTDDFILPNGTVMSANSTERQIFDTFGRAWAVTADNTVMRYGPREDYRNYSHPEFVPVFLDKQSSEIRDQARSVCGDNLACMYDYVATGSLQYAMNSKSVKENADQVNDLIKNSIPQIQAPSKLKVVAEKTVNFALIGSDQDGDELTYHTENDENDAVQVNMTTGLVQYTPRVDKPVQLRFYAKDSKDVRSTTEQIEVFVCSGCSGHGRCDYDSFEDEERAPSFTFHRVVCVCEPAWDGLDCEDDRDGCIGNPCLEGQTCRDFNPSIQGSKVIGFDCVDCPAGFDKAPDEPYCLDIDECESSTLNNCNKTCTNTRGSYSCGCTAGFRLNNDGNTCGDIDECQEKTDNCDQICVNTDGAYECRCEGGYSQDASSNSCRQDTDLAAECRYSGCSQGCKRGTDPDSGTSVLECFCFAGYDNTTDDAAECEDHDECQDNVSVCTQGCVNLNGGFACTCYIGFQLAEDRTTCLPCPALSYGANCQLTCRCSGRAVDCDPVTGCECQLGWRGADCQDDVDECSETPNVCGNEHICVNTPGSFACRCSEGYSKDTNDECMDINECGELSLLNTCGELQSCNNVPGGFYCTCTNGYIMSNGRCVDIDECSLGISDCEQECTNLPGSYNCDCRYGYRLNVDRATCSQVSDICAAEENLSCDHGCTLNDEDRAVCFCNMGFALQTDGQTCNRVSSCATFGCSHACTTNDNKPQCSCPAGKILDVNLRTCLDCPQGTFGVNCASQCSCGLGALLCNASEGCVCKDGWTGDRCERDVNECDDTSVSQQCQAKGAVCENTPGSYRCACRKGFKMDDSEICQDINECRGYPCGQQCENSAGSYRCLCSRGFSLEKATGSCNDIDECALSATNMCTQTCINLDGSYRCACRPGFVLSADGVSCTISAACNRTNCPKENGGCSEEQCFCNSGYQLSGSNTCEAIRTNWCSVPVCEQECQEISNGSTPFNCSCRDGYILNDDKKTCREKEVASGCSRTDCPTENGGCSEEQCFCNTGYRLSDANMCEPTVGACNRKDCPTENGGCRMERCFCDSGYELSESNTCQAKEPEKINVIFTVGVQLTIQASELNNKESSTYLNLSQEVAQELKKKLGPVGAGIVDIRVTSLRIGSLIVDADVLVDKVNFPDVMSSLAGQLQLLRKDKFVIQGQSGDVIQMAVKGTEVGSSWTSCQVLQTISPCSADQLCDESGEQPVCRSKDEQTPGSTDSTLAIGLGVGLGVLALIVIAVACYCCKKGKSSGIADDNRYIRPGSAPGKRPASENPYDQPQFNNQAYQADNPREHGLQEGNYSSLDAARLSQPYDRLQTRPGSASSIGVAFGPGKN